MTYLILGNKLAVSPYCLNKGAMLESAVHGPLYCRQIRNTVSNNSPSKINNIRGGADKSLARPVWKQTTTTKLEINSTYSPRSSIHFFSPLPQLLQATQKNSESCPPGQVSAAAMTSASYEKWRQFNCFFQSREQVVGQRGHIRRIAWVIKTLEAQVGQFLLDCKCPVSRGIVVEEQDPLGDLPSAWHFSFKMSFNCTSRDE